MFKIKKKFNIDKSKENKNTIFWKLDWIIFSKEFDGKNPPDETKLILKFKELNILTSEKLSNRKVRKLNTEYKIKILSKVFLIFSSE